MRQLSLFDVGAPARAPPRRGALDFQKLNKILQKRFGHGYTDEMLDLVARPDEPRLATLIAEDATDAYVDHIRSGRLIRAMSSREISHLVDARQLSNSNDFETIHTQHGTGTRSLLECVVPCAPKMRALLRRGADPNHVCAHEDGRPIAPGARLVEIILQDERLASSRCGTDVLRALFDHGVEATDRLVMVGLAHYGYFSCVINTIIRQMRKQREHKFKLRRQSARARLLAIYWALRLRCWAVRARERAWLPETMHVAKLQRRFHAHADQRNSVLTGL
jgi:hypothetical protein